MKNLKKMKRKCRSYPTLILTTVAIVPMLDDFINWSHSIALNKMTTTFVKVHDMKFPAASNMEDLGDPDSDGVRMFGGGQRGVGMLSVVECDETRRATVDETKN